jgi:signal transduction histidine kinase
MQAKAGRPTIDGNVCPQEGLPPAEAARRRQAVKTSKAPGTIQVAAPGEATDLVARARAWIMGLRGQLIVPYAILTLLMATLGIFVVTRLVTSSVRERFLNQIREAGQVASDGMVRRERAHLQALRLMTFSAGVPEALQAGDANLLVGILQPLALNEQSESVVALNAAGREVVSLTWDAEANQYLMMTGGASFASEPLVSRILVSGADTVGDKYVGIVDTSLGRILYTSSPVRTEAGALAGVLLLGTRLDTLAHDLQTQANGDILLRDNEGYLLATTLTDETGYPPGFERVDPAANDYAATFKFRHNDRQYEMGYEVWQARQEPLGFLGVALPSSFVVSAEATSRTWFSLIFSLGTVLTIVVGYLLAASISRPILHLRRMAQAVATGDLDQSSGLQREDEIGDLASAFDTMTGRLKERTEEAERLYVEAVERNRQLKEMFDQLRTAQQQLVQSEKLASVGQLSAGIVHDVKNPLGVIKGIAEEMLEDAAEASQEADSLKLIRDNATRANTIVTDMLTFARQSTPAMLRRDLRETVEGCLRLTSYMLRKGKVEVETSIPQTPVMVTYDAQQMQQVLVNLIQNAVQAMPDGGKLAVRLVQDDGTVTIDVQDSGVGIPPENLGRIFDPFFTTKPEGQGTGMGLSTSYGIIARHAGTIDVRSTVGEGSTFAIRIPVQPPSSGSEGE